MDSPAPRPRRRALPAALLTLASIAGVASAQAPPTPTPSERPPTDTLVLPARGLTRTLVLDAAGALSTLALTLPDTAARFVHPGAPEFRFRVDGKLVTSLSGWALVARETDTTGFAHDVKLVGATDATRGLELGLRYDGRSRGLQAKRLTLVNRRADTLRLEAVDLEHLSVAMGRTHAVVYADYARHRRFGAYVGDWDDPALALHDQERGLGFVVVNEAPGVLKRTACLDDGYNLTAGLTRPGQAYPFRVYLAPGESWVSPRVATGLYVARGGPGEFWRKPLPDYLRHHLDGHGARIHRTPARPSLVTNTWRPFQDDLHEAKLLEYVDAAAEIGAEQVTIDAGWYTTYGEGARALSWADQTGDWIVDSVKFPRGLSPVFARMRARGVAPGLWLALTSAHPVSRVYRAHPEWFVVGPDGAATNLHNPANEIRTACFATGWRDYILEVIDGYVRAHGLRYVKLDLSVVTSAYIDDPAASGCHARDHPGHRDHAESLWRNYERLFGLFDTLHARHPDLFIDCTFETAGRLQLLDYAFAAHAEGDWLSNIEDPEPYGSLRARHLAWRRSRVLPASALAIGNLSLEGDDYELAIQSVLGALPLVLGDHRGYAPAKRARLRAWAEWIRAAEARHGFLDFRQDVAGFGEPAAGGWDAYQRIDDETGGGGIVGAFRNDSPEPERRVVLWGLDPTRRYTLREAPSGKTVYAATGAALMGEGFVAALPERWRGRVWEVRGE